MKIKRLRYLLSPKRLRYCRMYFRSPYRAFFDCSFLRSQPFALVMKNGRTATFSHERKDHKFWDWFFSSFPGQVEFTEAGEVCLRAARYAVLLRPGSQDFSLFEEILLDDVYRLRDLPGPLRNVIDLGGNVGFFSSAVLSGANQVVTVEPVEVNYHQAVRNVVLNHGNPDNVLHRAAAGTSGQRVPIFVSREHSYLHSVSREWAGSAGDSETVESVSLANLVERFGDEPIDLVKCDIEGAEYDVFLSAAPSVLQRIRRIHMELHISPEFSQSLADQLVFHLTRSGFTIESNEPALADEVRATRLLRAFRAKEDVLGGGLPQSRLGIARIAPRQMLDEAPCIELFRHGRHHKRATSTRHWSSCWRATGSPKCGSESSEIRPSRGCASTLPLRASESLYVEAVK